MPANLQQHIDWVKEECGNEPPANQILLCVRRALLDTGWVASRKEMLSELRDIEGYLFDQLQILAPKSNNKIIPF